MRRKIKQILVVAVVFLAVFSFVSLPISYAQTTSTSSAARIEALRKQVQILIQLVQQLTARLAALKASGTISQSQQTGNSYVSSTTAGVSSQSAGFTSSLDSAQLTTIIDAGTFGLGGADVSKNGNASFGPADVLADGSSVYMVFGHSKTTGPAYAPVSYENGIYFSRSSDGGKSWSSKVKIADLDRNSSGLGLELTKKDNVLFLSGSHVNSLSGGLIYSSSDNGSTWRALTVPAGASMQNGDYLHSFSLLPLSASNLLLAYLDNSGVLRVVKSSDGGSSWNAGVEIGRYIPTGQGLNIGFVEPILRDLGSNKVGLVYKRSHAISNSLERQIKYRESSDGGNSWGQEETVAGAGNMRYDGSDGGGNFITISKSPFFFSVGSKKIVAYIKKEYMRPEPANTVPSISVSDSSGNWRDAVVYTTDGRNATARGEENKFIFAASPNGKYLAFMGIGDIAQRGFYAGASDSMVSFRGVMVLYSTDSGSTWKAKQILKEFDTSGSKAQDKLHLDGSVGESMLLTGSGFSVNNSGEMFVAVPESTFKYNADPKVGHNYRVRLNFLGGKLD